MNEREVSEGQDKRSGRLKGHAPRHSADHTCSPYYCHSSSTWEAYSSSDIFLGKRKCFEERIVRISVLF